MTRFDERREPRACERCGYIRKVKVIPLTTYNPQTKEPVHEELCNRYCTACEAEFSAARHAKAYAHEMAKAKRLRAAQHRRAAKQLQKGLTEAKKSKRKG